MGLEESNHQAVGCRNIELSLSIERVSNAKLEGRGMRFGIAVFMEFSDRRP